MFGYLTVAAVAVMLFVAMVLWLADRMGSSSIRIKGSILKLLTFEVELGGSAPDAPRARLEKVPRRRRRRR